MRVNVAMIAVQRGDAHGCWGRAVASLHALLPTPARLSARARHLRLWWTRFALREIAQAQGSRTRFAGDGGVGGVDSSKLISATLPGSRLGCIRRRSHTRPRAQGSGLRARAADQGPPV